MSGALTRMLIGRPDLVLAMTRAHGEHIASVDPEAAGRTFLLSEFADGGDVDVPDPIGAPREEYESVFEMMESYLKRALPAIMKLAGEGER